MGGLNKKRRIKVVLLAMVLGLLVIMGVLLTLKLREKKAMEDSLQHLPNFDFTTLDGASYTQDQLPEEMPTVFIFFHADCDFCQHEAQQLQEHIALLKNIQILMISEQPVHSIEEFAVSYQLDQKDHITFLQDVNSAFANRFAVTSVPFVLLYDRHGRLQKIHKGQLAPASLLNYVHQEIK